MCSPTSMLVSARGDASRRALMPSRSRSGGETGEDEDDQVQQREPDEDARPRTGQKATASTDGDQRDQRCSRPRELACAILLAAELLAGLDGARAAPCSVSTWLTRLRNTPIGEEDARPAGRPRDGDPDALRRRAPAASRRCGAGWRTQDVRGVTLVCLPSTHGPPTRGGVSGGGSWRSAHTIPRLRRQCQRECRRGRRPVRVCARRRRASR